MDSELYPLRFKPVYKDYLWGGDRLARRYGRVLPPGPVAESWEVADHPDGMSVVENGPMAGRTLHELVVRWGPDLLGRGSSETAFPLLVKLIDARQRLSVQVHPDDRSAREQGGDPKTEMWYVLDADPGSGVFAGFRRGVNPAALQRALATRRVEELMRFVPLAPGDAVYIPGGRVHTIDAGCLLLEIQQRSNTTYRLYDWDRIGPDGRPRPLHVEQALRAIRWDDTEPDKAAPVSEERVGGHRRRVVLRSAFFALEQWNPAGPWRLPEEEETCRILFVAEGEASVEAGGRAETLAAGASCLLPAALRGARLVPGPAGAEVLLVTRPARA